MIRDGAVLVTRVEEVLEEVGRIGVHLAEEPAGRRRAAHRRAQRARRRSSTTPCPRGPRRGRLARDRGRCAAQRRARGAGRARPPGAGRARGRSMATPYAELTMGRDRGRARADSAHCSHVLAEQSTVGEDARRCARWPAPGTERARQEPNWLPSGSRRSGLSSSSMLTSLKVSTRTFFTKRAGRYMSQTQASDMRTSK